MIQLKNRPDPPDNLQGDIVKNRIDSLRVKVAAGTDTNSEDFPDYWKNSRKILWKLQNKKCCYCERKRKYNRESDLEHFRPKGKVAEEDSHPGYWWLAYDFNNYLFSCKICNQDHKGSKFPLIDPLTRVYLESDDLNTETPFLIDPFSENPEDFIGYTWEGIESKYVGIISKEFDSDNRAIITSDIVGLDRLELHEQRASLLDMLYGLSDSVKYLKMAENKKDELNKWKAKILRVTSSDKKFCGFKRYFFMQMGLEDCISNE